MTMTSTKAQISLNGIKLKDQYQGDDGICEVTEIVNYERYSKITIQNIRLKGSFVFFVGKNENNDWLAHDFKKVAKKPELDDNAQSWLWMCGQ